MHSWSSQHIIRSGRPNDTILREGSQPRRNCSFDVFWVIGLYTVVWWLQYYHMHCAMTWNAMLLPWKDRHMYNRQNDNHISLGFTIHLHFLSVTLHVKRLKIRQLGYHTPWQADYFWKCVEIGYLLWNRRSLISYLSDSYHGTLMPPGIWWSFRRILRFPSKSQIGIGQRLGCQGKPRLIPLLVHM